MSEETGEESKESGKTGDEELETIVVENEITKVVKENDIAIVENKMSGEGDKVQHVEIEIHEEGEKKIVQTNNDSTPQILINKPLCADYESSTDTESDSESSSDSDSDSDSSSVDSDSDSSSQEESSDDLQQIHDELEARQKTQKKESKTDFDLSDLPPIENLRISVPEEQCQEMGTITSIVDTLVVVQAYKDTPALDLDTVLFLDMGQKSLGRIFDVLGPVSEPVYTVRFNSVDEIVENNITKGLKVYCAPKTEYTSFVFVSELMKMKGSDASWKNNEEAPPEYQDFSDDEEENKFKHGEKNLTNPQRPPSSDNGNRKKPRVHHGRPNFPGRSANYRNPFALGHVRTQRYNHPPPTVQQIYPDNSRAPPMFYNMQNNFHPGGMMMRPPVPMYPNYPYPYQQYPSYPMQQFAMPPVMPPPPPPAPSNANSSTGEQTPMRVFGRNIDGPSESS